MHKRNYWIIPLSFAIVADVMAQDALNYQLLYMQRLQDLQDALKSRPVTLPPTFQAFQNAMMQVGVKFWTTVWENPAHMLDAQQRYLEMLRAPSANDNHYDRYFKSDLWQSDPYFKWLKDIYIKTAEWMIETIEEEALGFDEEERKKLLFLTRQIVEGMNPRNFPLTNPDILKEAVETNGENFLRGLDNLIKDIRRGTVSMTDDTAFTPGKNVAATKGHVIYQNKMMELLYFPANAETAFKEPLVIIPPWINKYYILDLTPDNSMIKWLTEQGHHVFCISWANPDETYRDVAFKDYMHDGALKAIEIANTMAGTHKANVIGYCIGGTLLAMTLAWLEGKKKKSPVQSATFLTTLLDFEKAGDLRVFIDKDQIQSLNQTLMKTGVMDGKSMSMTFSLLRASDLIWSFVINNYLMGKDPVPFDLLYWNSDSTNLPAAMHCDYLQSMYLDNLLPLGEYTLDGVKLDLAKVQTPAYFLSTCDDHIAPWEATKDGAELLGGDVTFVLGGSGHIAGVINPPHKNKYGFEVDGKSHKGSWWPHWQEWVMRQNGKASKIDATVLTHSSYKTMGTAPGTYVLKKI